MTCEIERMEINYTFYFFAFLRKMIKKLLTFCYWMYRLFLLQKTGNCILVKILMKSGFGLGSEREKLCILSFEDFGCGRNDVVAR